MYESTFSFNHSDDGRCGAKFLQEGVQGRFPSIKRISDTVCRIVFCSDAFMCTSSVLVYALITHCVTAEQPEKRLLSASHKVALHLTFFKSLAVAKSPTGEMG